MLTLDVLYAVLQGLDPSYLTHLDMTWKIFCMRINNALSQGSDPLSAFKTAVFQTRPRDFVGIKKMLREARPVMNLPGLSRRQKDALVALRYSRIASLSQLCQVLAMDRSNTFRTLKALVVKRLVFKFIRKDGVYYYAVPAPLDNSVKTEINRLLLGQLSAPELPPQPAEVTTLTTPTTPTMLTMPTMFQKSTTPTTTS